jgi:hypothetical protein
MPWSLDYLGPKEPELIDEFLLAVGKAVYLAAAFESKCGYLLELARLVHRLDVKPVDEDISATFELLRAMRDKLLHGTIKELATFPAFTADEIAILDRAREARNVIVHEIADLGPLSRITATAIAEATARLRLQLLALVPADNLVSKWLCEIDEWREPAPRDIQEKYPHWVELWVFRDEPRTAGEETP